MEEHNQHPNTHSNMVFHFSIQICSSQVSSIFSLNVVIYVHLVHQNLLEFLIVCLCIPILPKKKIKRKLYILQITYTGICTHKSLNDNFHFIMVLKPTQFKDR